MSKTFQMKKDEALIQLARTSRAGDEDEMQLNIIRGKTHIRLGMSMTDFAELLTGAAHIPIKIRRWEKRK